MALRKALASSIGTKVLIALTGLALFLFLAVHLIGNLLIVVGPDTFNRYSHALITNPFLVPAEIGLAAIFLLHGYKTVAMWLANRRARPVAYGKTVPAGGASRKGLASTTMIVTGLATLVFVVLHLKTFKYGPYYEVASTPMRDLARLMFEVFTRPSYVAFYVVCMALLGLHLRHGFSSAFQSLGADHPAITPGILAVGKVLAVLIGGGFAFIPLWILFGGGRP